MVEDPLYFLPGFLGQPDDFDTVTDLLSIKTKTFSWPESRNNQILNGYAQYSWEQHQHDFADQFYLYAYSMGGRIAMHWLDNPEFKRRCKGLFIASAHTGFNTDDEKQARLKHDQAWAVEFATKPINATLQRWYDQPIFSSLNAEQKDYLIRKKSTLNGALMAKQLVTASLGQQVNLSGSLMAAENTVYVVGLNDTKFLTLARSLKLPNELITFACAGHVLHLEQPKQLAQIISKQIEHWRTTQ